MGECRAMMSYAKALGSALVPDLRGRHQVRCWLTAAMMLLTIPALWESRARGEDDPPSSQTFGEEIDQIHQELFDGSPWNGNFWVIDVPQGASLAEGAIYSGQIPDGEAFQFRVKWLTPIAWDDPDVLDELAGSSLDPEEIQDAIDLFGATSTDFASVSGELINGTTTIAVTGIVASGDGGQGQVHLFLPFVEVDPAFLLDEGEFLVDLAGSRGTQYATGLFSVYVTTGITEDQFDEVRDLVPRHPELFLNPEQVQSRLLELYDPGAQPVQTGDGGTGPTWTPDIIWPDHWESPPHPIEALQNCDGCWDTFNTTKDAIQSQYDELVDDAWQDYIDQVFFPGGMWDQYQASVNAARAQAQASLDILKRTAIIGACVCLVTAILSQGRYSVLAAICFGGWGGATLTQLQQIVSSFTAARN